MENSKGKINRATTILTKILEVIHWIGGTVLGILIFFTVFFNDKISEVIEQTKMAGGGPIHIYGMDVTITNPDQTINIFAVMLAALGGMVVMILFALVFRKVYLILQTANGKTSFAKGATPFQEDVVKMFKQIGYFLISIAVVEVLTGMFVGFAVGTGPEVGLNLIYVVMGLLVLSLSEYFKYGMALQEDVDGLL